IKVHKLTEEERSLAKQIARRIALHPISRDRVPEHHLGEAEIMVLAQRPEFKDALVLLDELAARKIAEEMGLLLSGFIGVLLLGVQKGLLTAEELKGKLEQCKRLGTRYSNALIEWAYELARKEEKGDE
ncbi:MAG: hypothetical protein DRI61_12595, partial [Chloroflexi bacterium]